MNVFVVFRVEYCAQDGEHDIISGVALSKKEALEIVVDAVNKYHPVGECNCDGEDDGDGMCACYIFPFKIVERSTGVGGNKIGEQVYRAMDEVKEELAQIPPTKSAMKTSGEVRIPSAPGGPVSPGSAAGSDGEDGTVVKVKNPKTGRMIAVGKGVYKGLLEEGYQYIGGVLVPPGQTLEQAIAAQAK